MQRSETITKISAALVKAQLEMGNAVKDAVNPFFKKNYADINAVREATLPALNKHGISVIQPTCVLDGKNYVETVLLHESGEFISSLTEIVVDKVNDAQRHGSGLSYARRYALQSITNIGAEDDDANKATGKVDAGNKEKQVQPVEKMTAAEIKILDEEVTAAILSLARINDKAKVAHFCHEQKPHIVNDARFQEAARNRVQAVS